MLRNVLLISSLLCSFLSSATYAQEKPSYQHVSTLTQSVAEKYFKAYIALDWDTVERLLAENGSFEDPTAQLVFGQVKHDTKEATMNNFRNGYAGITHMQFNPSRTFFSGQYAIFEGTLDWSLKLSKDQLAETKAMPFVTILKVDNNKVVEHKDFADYAPFFAAINRSTPKQ